MEVEFFACAELDYDPNYGNCKRQLISSGGTTKMCWKRAGNGDLVQFCKLRGRINSPVGCLSKENAVCSDFKDVARAVEVSQEELDS